ncbi:MAG: ImmA/IrrE family metallo-endopeptidase [Methanosphaera sp.]|nr:ImmA/IrrE family metallo-endopeptidase [Methanosphaera sp.]
MEIPDNYYEISEQANNCRRKWNINENSPIDIFAEVLDKIDNVTLCFLDMEDNLSGSSFKTGKNKVIFINSNHPLGRQRFTLAHEVYHLEYQKEFVNCDIDSSDDEIEADADQFASCLLMSNGALFNYERENNIKEWDLDYIMKAQQYFQISNSAMLRRLHSLDKISDSQKEKYSYNVMLNARERGYDLKLYKPYTEKNNLVLGNYIRLTNTAYNKGLISKAKKDELLIDAYEEI